MLGRLLRVTGTVLVIAVGFVTPVLATSTPASADTVVDGCIIVSNPTPTNFTNCPGADLSGANLSGVNLSYANFAGTKFAECYVSGQFQFGGFSIPTYTCDSASLNGAQLVDADLSNSILGFIFVNLSFPPFPSGGEAGADLSGANLTGADLTGAALGNCVFFGFCFGANLGGADVSDTIFVPPNQTVEATGTAGAAVNYSAQASCSPPSGATFPVGTTTVSCTLPDFHNGFATGTFTVTVDLPTSTSLSSSTNPSVLGESVTYAAKVSPTPPGGTVAFSDNGSPITGCSAVPLSGASATCSATPGTTGAHNIVATYSGSGGFLGSTSPGVTQVVTKTPCTTLAGCNLSGVNLESAGMAGSDLQGANIKGANLSSANLSGANVSGANLNGANLTGANLSGANLSGANFNGANLTGANLGGATVTVDTNFNGATWVHTTCPDGTSSDNDSDTCIGHL